MRDPGRPGLRMLRALAVVLTFAHIAWGQLPGPAKAPAVTVYHRIEGQIQQRNKSVDNIRVRLVRIPQMQPIADIFTRQDGHFEFQSVPTGDYLIETFETDTFEATQTQVSVFPRNALEPSPTSAALFIVLPLKAAPERMPPGEVMADVDLNVPKKALKHYETGMKKSDKGDSAQAVAEFRAAIEIYPSYYAARLELGRELRLSRRFPDALEVVQSLAALAPKRAEPRIEHGIILLALQRRDDAIHELEAALRLGESSWAAHLYLGWALLEQDEAKAEPHFKRAIEINERKAARAHLALARLAENKGHRLLALSHLDAYLALAPNANDAEAARKLAERLRSQD
jgi:tetratricopeptide (TPR) repeat protein